MLAWWLGEGDEAWSRTVLEPFAAASEQAGVPFVVSPIEATAIGSWVQPWRERGLVFTRGMQSAYRAARATDAFLSCEPRHPAAPDAPDDDRPPALIASDVGPIVGFGDAMRLLAAAGVPVAPCVVLAEGQLDDPGVDALGPRLVVKLADVAHRTELGVVAGPETG